MPEEPDSPTMTVRLRLGVCYDGTEFSGWALQPGRRTVAGTLGEALQTLFGVAVPMVVAGRTDAGVHATGQVAHIDVDREVLAGLVPRHLRTGVTSGGTVDASSDPSREESTGWADALAAGAVGLRRRLAGLLPLDLRITATSLAPAGFDARFSATRRHYRYRIACSEWGAPPLRRADTLVWRRPLDTDAMQRAADRLVGLRDFAAYCKPREGATTIRDLQRLTVTARPLGPAAAPAAGAAGDPGTLVRIDVTADAFCHSMVRSLVGALLAVGAARMAVHVPAEVLAAGRRAAELAVAPAHGLTLVGVDYPSDAEMAHRAVQTRALRTMPS